MNPSCLVDSGGRGYGSTTAALVVTRSYLSDTHPPHMVAAIPPQFTVATAAMGATTREREQMAVTSAVPEVAQAVMEATQARQARHRCEQHQRCQLLAHLDRQLQ